MRKLLLAIVAVALFAGMAMAQPSATGTININVPVGGRFSITLAPASGSTITYPTLYPGDVDATTGVVGITVLSNYKNTTWGLQVHQNQLLTDAAITEAIPSASFTHTSTGGTGGTHLDATATIFTTTTATTFYTCGPLEQQNLPLGSTISQAMRLAIPNNQASGTYINTLTYTLTAHP